MSLRLASFLAAACLATGLHAQTLRWSSQGDFLTMDPHAQNESLNNTAATYVYESLLSYNEKFELEPALAESYKQESTLIWRFNLRKGVKWHDGSPFTADDVVFSMERVAAPTSNFRVYTTGIQGARKVDDNTVLIYTSVPNPVLLRQLTEIRIMNGQCLDRRLESQRLIAREVAAWEDKRNAQEARIHWTFTLAAARRKLRKLYPSIEG